MFSMTVKGSIVWMLLLTQWHSAFAEDTRKRFNSRGFVSGSTEVQWGQNINRVKQLEAQQLLEEKPHALTYDALLGTTDYQLEYLFDQSRGRLEEKLYYRTLIAGNRECRNEFRRILTMLIESYGKPGEDADDTITCNVKASRHWVLGSGEQVELVLDSWKGQPYIGLRFRPEMLSRN